MVSLAKHKDWKQVETAGPTQSKVKKYQHL